MNAQKSTYKIVTNGQFLALDTKEYLLYNEK